MGRLQEVSVGKSSRVQRHQRATTSVTGSEPDARDRDDKTTVPAHEDISEMEESLRVPNTTIPYSMCRHSKL